MESIEKEKMTITPPSAVTLGMTTFEDLSTLLVTQSSDQERYALSENIIVDQVTYPDTLLEEIETRPDSDTKTF